MHFRILFLFIFSLQLNLVFGTSVSVSSLDGGSKILDLEHGSIYLPKTKMTLEEVMKQNFSLTNIEVNVDTIRFLWYKVDVVNNTNKEIGLYFNSNYNDYAEVFILKGDQLISSSKSGAIRKKNELQFPYDFTHTVNEIPGDSAVYTVYLNLESWYYANIYEDVLIFNENYLHESIAKNYRSWSSQVMFDLIFIGVIFLAFVIILSMAINTRNKLYMIYASYVFALLLYGISHMNNFYPIFGELVSINPPFFHFLNRFSLFLFSGIYPWFLISIFSISKVKHKWLYYPLMWYSIFCIVYSLYLMGVTYFHGAGEYDSIAELARLLMLLVHVYTNLYLLFGVKHRFKWLIFTGSTALMVLTLVGVYQVYIKAGPPILLGYEIKYATYLELGILIELLFFSIAMGKFTSLLQKDKSDLLLKNVEQLTANKLAIDRMNEELQTKLEEQTKVAIDGRKKIEKEREKQLTVAYQLKLLEARLDTLRSQINPHFIFNSLNSIYHLILKEQNNKAEHYIIEFSRLLRSILEYSRKESISIFEELDVNKVYLNLENYRLNGKLNISITNDIEEESQNIQIPPLLLQPFLENAIWHGLIPKEDEECNLKIHLFKEAQSFFIRITDNGIGREAASSKKNIDKESLGTNISNERIKLFNMRNREQLSLSISDFNANLRTGTVVEIKIDLKEND